MTGLSAAVARKFCELGSWAHTVWSMHRSFQDDPRTEVLGKGEHAWFLNNLSMMSAEYVLLQVAKLHDPACQQGRLNLTIPYVFEYGGWADSTRADLGEMVAELAGLFEQIRGARHRIIAHNDLATLLADVPLGHFGTEDDIAYFAALERFCCRVHEEVVGEPFTFGPQAATDVSVVLRALSQEARAEA